jgi:type VI protein secretion system component Hcp
MADSDIFLSFEGVKGEHELPSSTVRPGPGDNWTQLVRCEFRADANAQSRAVSKGASNRIDFGGLAPPVEIRKVTDATTLGLMREVLVGKTARRAVIVFTRTTVDGPTEYLRYELDGCRVVAFNFAAGDSDRTIETFQLHYVRMSVIAYAGGHGVKGAQASAVLQNGI